MTDEFVDQQSMTDDFFSDSEPLVYQDTGEPVNSAPVDQPTNATPATNEQTDNQPVQQPAQPAQPVQEAQPVEDAPPAPVEDPFSFMETNEQGESSFNALSALEFMEKKNAVVEQETQIEAPQVVQPEVQATQSQEQEISYEDAVKSNLSTGLDYVTEALNAGYTHEQAIQYAQGQVNNDIKEHLLNKRFQDQEKSFEERLADKKTEATHAEEMTALRPKSTANMHEMAKASGYQSIEQYQKVLTHPQYGGGLINYFFNNSPEGKQQFKTQEEISTAMNDWFVKFTSDRQSLAILDKLTKAEIMNQKMPEIVKAVREGKIKHDESNKNGQAMAGAAIQNQPRTQPSQSGSFESYIGLPDEV